MTVGISRRARRQTSLCVCHTDMNNERKMHDKIKKKKSKSMPQHNTRIRYDERTSEARRSLTICTRPETQFYEIKIFSKLQNYRITELQKLRLEFTAK
jgi:hypothetical protein